MKPYEIAYSKAAEKFFLKHEDIRKKYEEAIRKIIRADHPEQVDVKKLAGRNAPYYRIRIGNYRVVYLVLDGKIVVINTLSAGPRNTLSAGPRGDVYKKIH